MAEKQLVLIEVAFALPDKQVIIPLSVPEGTTAKEAVALSQIEAQFPEIDFKAESIGIFGQKLADPEAHPLKAGDRVEIYRPLQADPKEIRRLRAEKMQARNRK